MSAMRYGLPYKGSKNSIAREIVDQLPPAEYFVDLFAGGGAITHAAMESGKFDKFIMNDIESGLTELFKDAVYGKYQNEQRWISREDFKSLKDTDHYVRYCWSFGNNGFTYLYSQEVEPWKRALHYARVFKDFSELEKFGIVSDGSQADIVKHHDEYKKKYIAWYQINVMHSREVYEAELEKLTRNIEHNKAELRAYLLVALKASGLRSADIDRHLGTNGMAGHYFGKSQWEFPTRENYIKLQEIMPLYQDYDIIYGLQELWQSLQRLQSLQSYSTDYSEIQIPENSVVYCDIPYRGTDEYVTGGFDYERFYKWALKQKNIYISEYQMPEPFVSVWKKEKVQLLNGAGAGSKKIENIYTVPSNTNRPLTLVDFMEV